MPTPTHRERQSLTRSMIGPQVPRLWCPPITHYTPDGEIDLVRTEAHWRTMVAHVGGFLVPGSTGDGWQMSEEEVAGALAVATDLAVRLDTRLLIGVLRTDVEAMLSVIAATLETLAAEAGTGDALEAMRRRHVAAITVCPPQGASLSQRAIRAGLGTVLDLGLPTAIYQLPQVTDNEISPESFRDLTEAYGNVLLFKDTSGGDRVPQSDHADDGVFYVRGAEGDYAARLRESGGCYDGLLLSSANGFAGEFAEMIALLEAGNMVAARTLSDRITRAVGEAFAAVAAVPEGNAFSNANKAIDHVRAYGAEALHVAPPRLHDGGHLPQPVVEQVVSILKAYGFLPATGYLQ